MNGEYLIHGCDLKDAEVYSDFLVYPESHFDIWDAHYAKGYGMDYDYFPRGRVAYHKPTVTEAILYDRSLENSIGSFAVNYTDKTSLDYDEHYQCHLCNDNYVI